MSYVSDKIAAARAMGHTIAAEIEELLLSIEQHVGLKAPAAAAAEIALVPVPIIAAADPAPAPAAAPPSTPIA